jgi:hypothetical protein
MKTMNSMTMLNAKQINVLNDYVRNGKKEAFVKSRINFFGVKSEDQAAIYSQLISANKEVHITELDKDFSGLQICTEINLNTLMSNGFSGDWKINVKRAAACGYLRVFSLTDRSLFFIARITGFEPLPNGKYKILFADADLQRHEFKNIKFNRNVVRYINMPENAKKRKKK